MPCLRARNVEPAAEGVADHAHVGRRARERRETVLGGRFDDLDPDRSGVRARGARHGVDGDAAQLVHLEQDRVRERPESAGAVPRPVRRDLQAAVARIGDDLDDVLDGLRDSHGDRPLVDREVPRATRLVPALVSRDHDLADHVRAQLAHVESAGPVRPHHVVHPSSLLPK